MLYSVAAMFTVVLAPLFFKVFEPRMSVHLLMLQKREGLLLM